MVQTDTKPMLWAEEPTKWPAAPQWMSFYRLREIERCPRRAALRSATYPEIWHLPGYPPILCLSALVGQVVHSSVRTLSMYLAKNGCQSASEERAVAVFTQLGGLSQVISHGIDTVFEIESENPRGLAARQSLRDAVNANIPFIREQVQVLLSRLHFGRFASTSTKRTERTESPQYPSERSHGEIELRVPALGWVGVADYIGLFGNCCEIIDFKSGDPEEEHKLQILIYALLWARDRKINPEGLLANKLTISYRSGTIDIPAPTEHELVELEQEITTRTEAARNDLRVSPPQAKPSAENCTFCDVRHLCNAYWSRETLLRLSEQNPSLSGHTDLQLKIVSQQAMKCWKAVVVSSRTLPPESPVLLRTSVSDNSLDEALMSGSVNQIRIMVARLMNDAVDGSPALVTMSERSEGFLVR